MLSSLIFKYIHPAGMNQTSVDRDAESTSEESKHWEESRPAAGTGLSNNFQKAEGTWPWGW